MKPQLLNRLLKPVIGGNLLLLARLHSFQIGENHVGQQLGDNILGLVHKQILNNRGPNRIITGGSTLVMERCKKTLPANAFVTVL